MYGYIYKTTNLINNKFYIGKREKSSFDEKYYGSGIHLKNAINKYGIENFDREIVEWCSSRTELCERERYWIKVLNAQNPEIGYNIADGGDGGVHLCGDKNPSRINPRKQSQQERDRRSKSLMGHSASQETRDKISKSNTGKIRSAEQRLANSIRNKNKVWIYKDNKQTTVQRELLESYLNSGWKLGRLKNSKPAWNKGLTKETDERMSKISKSRLELFKKRGSIGCYGIKNNKFSKGQKLSEICKN